MRPSLILRAVVVPLASAAAILALALSHLPFATLAILVALLILCIDLATLTRGHIQNGLVVLSTLAFGLAIVEGVMEWRLPHVDRTSPRGLWAKDPDLGYGLGHAGVVPMQKTVDGHLSYRASYTIDDGLRRLTKSPADGPRVRFFGDSYTFGEGLNDADTLPQVFADLTGANVLNYGYPGYCPAQALRILQTGRRDKELSGARLFVLQTATFHIERTSCMPEYTAGIPRYVTVNGKLVLDGVCKPTPGQSTGIYRSLLQGTVQKVGPAEAENYINIVNAFTRLAKEKYGAEALILFVADDSELKFTGLKSPQIMDRLREAGAIVIDDSVGGHHPEADLELPYDGHPSALANHLYAAKIADTIAKTRPGLLKAAAGSGIHAAQQ